MQPAEEEEPLFGRLPDGVCGVGPGQVIADVDPEEPEAAQTLHSSPVDGEGGVFYSLSLPVVHDWLLRFADVEMEVVVLALRRQGSDLLSVGLLIVAGDQAYDSRVISKLYDGLELWVSTQSSVNREYRRGLSTQPWGAPVFRVRVEDVVLPIRTTCGLPVRKFRIQSRRAMLSPRSLSLMTSFRGTMVLNA